MKMFTPNKDMEMGKRSGVETFTTSSCPAIQKEARGIH